MSGRWAVAMDEVGLVAWVVAVLILLVPTEK